MRKYKKPVLNVEQFTANEFIAACGDQNKVYKFKCDAPAGNLYIYPNSDGNIDGKHEWWRYHYKIGKYSPCGAEHEASTKSDFYDGFVDYNHNGFQDEGEGVIVWRGDNGRDGHATKNLDMSTWETAKS